MFDDLRGFLNILKSQGELKEISGADWDLEIGAITELLASELPSPALLFDRIKGYSPGFRIATNLFATEQRSALVLRLPPDLRGLDLVKAWREKIRSGIKPIDPVEVKDAPVKENIVEGEDVDLYRFPVPKWHELDGGRYIGTGSMTITRDPDEKWVNLGTYRVMLHDRNTTSFYMSVGRHGTIMRDKYWSQGKPCPAAICLGQDPTLWAMSVYTLPWGISEYGAAGWLRGKPVEITSAEETDLPIPAAAEIVLEGEAFPPSVEVREEGPFGEWMGYYVGHGKTGKRPNVPVFKVRRIYYRNDPILQGNPPFKPPIPFGVGEHILVSAAIWDAVEREVPDVRGVWVAKEASTWGALFTVISLRQRYPGHAKQAACVAAGCRAGAYMGRFYVVVDEDIDPSRMGDVLWALGTRCDPERSIDVIRETWSSEADPLISPERKGKGELIASKALILACKPYPWYEDFPKVNREISGLLARVQQKWGSILRGT